MTKFRINTVEEAGAAMSGQEAVFGILTISDRASRESTKTKVALQFLLF